MSDSTKTVQTVAIFPFNGLHFRVGRGGVGNLIGCSILVLLIDREDGKLPPAEAVNTVVGCNGKQTGGKGTALIVSVQVLVSAQKGFLRGILFDARPRYVPAMPKMEVRVDDAGQH